MQPMQPTKQHHMHQALNKFKYSHILSRQPGCVYSLKALPPWRLWHFVLLAYLALLVEAAEHLVQIAGKNLPPSWVVPSP